MAGQGSARVTLKEIDLSQVRDPQILPQGVPAAVVGTARKGPAFVPRTFANIQQFEEVFGSMSSRGRESNSNRIGPLALNEWLKSANAGTFLRVLGVGNGQAANAAGSVEDAGFIVGEELVQKPAGAGLGKVAQNPHAAISDRNLAKALGRTRFLGCFMKDVAGSSYLKDAGLPVDGHSSITIVATGLPEANDTIALDVINGNGDGDGLVGAQTFTVEDSNDNNDNTDSKLHLKTNGAVARSVFEFWDAAGTVISDNATLSAHISVNVVDTSADGDGTEATITITSSYTGVFGNENVITFSLAGDNTIVTVNDVTGDDLADAVNAVGGEGPAPVIRGVLMTPQGVVASLDVNSNIASLGNASSEDDTEIRDGAEGKSFGVANGDLVGYLVGEVDESQGFSIILNGFNPTEAAAEPAVISCSFDPDSSSYFAKVLNTDPDKIEELGHYLYAWWDIDKEVAVPSSLGLAHSGNAFAGTDYANMVGFLVEGQSGWNGADDDTLPNYENFSQRYQTAKTPWLVSQKFGDDDYKLFRLHSLDDGEIGGNQFRLLVSDLRYVNDARPGSFTLTLERLDTNPVDGDVIASWKNLSLDPDDRNYIARVIGDQHVYYNFDRDDEKQRLQVDGNFELRNNFVRVELSDDLLSGNVPVDALPSGFLGHAKLQTAVTGNFIEQADLAANRIFTAADGTAIEVLQDAQVPSVKFVRSISRTVIGSSLEASADLAWGVKFAKKEHADDDLKELSEIEFDSSIKSYAKFFPSIGTSSATKALIEDDGSDSSFARDRFSLENIEIASDPSSGIDWAGSVYRRSVSDAGVEANLVKISRDAKSVNVNFLKFRCMFQGGFDGVNIFDKEKQDLSGVASLREANDEKESKEYTGPTVVAYQKACDVLADKSAVELQVLALPGQRASAVTNYAMTACEERFDALYVMDIEEVDSSNELIESSDFKPSVANTITRFEGRVLDSSFGAAYFPDLAVRRTSDNAAIVVPPSVGVLGVISRNDRIKAPWFAPAGLNRGRVNSPGVKVQMNRDLLNDLYDADVNPIYEPAGRAGEVYVFGQKTLLQGESALDRINVRRLLIDIRRKVKAIGDTLLFEPNRESTLAKFTALVEPIMQDVQKRQGVARYKVQIDSSTTTQNDVENNTVRGKIYLQPLKSIEFISLDFVVTNTIE